MGVGGPSREATSVGGGSGRGLGLHGRSNALLERVLRDLHVGALLEEAELLLAEESLPRLDELVERRESPKRTDHVHDLGPEGPLFSLAEAHLDGADLPRRKVSELQALALVLHDRPDKSIQFYFTHEKILISPVWQRPQSRSPSRKLFCQIRRKYSINNKKIKVFSALIFLSYQTTPKLYSPAPNFHSSHYS